MFGYQSPKRGKILSDRLDSLRMPFTSPRFASCLVFENLLRLASLRGASASLRFASLRKNRNNPVRVPISQFLLSRIAEKINILSSSLALFPSKSTIATVHLVMQKPAAKIACYRNLIITCSFVDDQDNIETATVAE